MKNKIIISALLSIITIALVSSTAYADHTPQWVIDGCEADNYQSTYCREVLCHENPSDSRCSVVFPGPEEVERNDIQHVIERYCDLFPQHCPFDAPFPPDWPPGPEPCLSCPEPWAILYFSTLIQQGEFAELNNKLEGIQTQLDSVKGVVTQGIKIDTVPMPENQFNLIIGAIGLSIALSTIAIGASFRKR